MKKFLSFLMLMVVMSLASFGNTDKNSNSTNISQITSINADVINVDNSIAGIDQAAIISNKSEMKRLFWFVKNHKAYVQDPNMEKETAQGSGWFAKYLEYVNSNKFIAKQYVKYQWLRLGAAIEVAMAKQGLIGHAATITLADLITDFGTYLNQNRKDILLKLTQPTESQKFMTTIATQELEYRASKAAIDSVVQGFQKGWTPKGTAEFTPIAIPQRRHKVDLSFYPDEIVDTWIGFLADESIDRKAWPITRFIIEKLVIPKVNEERELALIGKGEYAAPAEGVAQASGKSMDGFMTILKALKTAGTSNVNFYTAGVLGEANVLDFHNDFLDWISPLYENTGMNIFESRDTFRKYQRAYQSAWGLKADFTEGMTNRINFSNSGLVALPSMAGEKVMFATPKSNFIRLINRNEGASNIMIESVDRQIKIFADWYESVGFAVEEAVFAYIPDEGSQSW
jgi:hypothetical protein